MATRSARYAIALAVLGCALGSIFTAMTLAAGARPVPPNIALYYGADLPIEELRAFDVVVVEPDHGFDPKTLNDRRTELFAYVSVGETAPSRKYFARLDPAWKIGENAAWGSIVTDQSLPEWHRFFVEEVIAPLWERGYRGFFLDTLDSYFLLDDKVHSWAKQVEGTATLIRAVKARYPEAKLLFNRGFDVIPKVREHVFTVAVESLLRSWNATEKRYTETSEKDHQETLAESVKLRDTLGLPVLIIDYVPPAERGLARETAAKIRALGFKPYITTPELDMVGVGDIEVAPRKVLVVLNEREATDLYYHAAQRYLATPLNYLGYTAEYLDFRAALPRTPLNGRYAGIVTWMSGPIDGESGDALRVWLKRQLSDGMRVAMFQSFPTALDDELAALIGVKPVLRATGTPVRITQRAAEVGFETEPIADANSVTPVRLAGADAAVPLLTLTSEAGPTTGQTFDVVAVTATGGFALAPYVIRDIPLAGYARWVIQPKDFVRRALALATLPAPDVTTENGRRLMLAHIDGDGFPSRAEVPGTPLAGELVRTELLEKYRVPTTFSVIEGEIGERGMHKALAPEMEALARKIYALPYIEAASHSYSHPFNWRMLINNSPERKNLRLHLDLPGYEFDLDTEMRGSLDYINKHLLPPGKRTEVFLWTGDCVVPPAGIKAAYDAGVVNMNGGETLITKSRPSWTLIAPVGIRKGGQFQVYAPNQNENVYTNDWTGPYHGFERVIETFEMTETPIRFKPINVYYHVYAVTKPSSIRAMHRIYEYAVKQPVFHVYGSEYARKAMDFASLSIARDHVRGGWRIRGRGELRTLRLAPQAAAPDLAASEGVAGFAPGPNALYLHLAGANAFVSDAPEAKPMPYLRSANGRLERWERRGDTIELRLNSHLPLELELGNAGRCELTKDGRTLRPAASPNDIKRYVLVDSGPHELAVRCR